MAVLKRLSTVLMLLLAVVSCTTTKYVPEGMFLLDKVDVVVDDSAGLADKAGIRPSAMKNYVRQRPNARWFASIKVPLIIYSASGRDSSKWLNRAMRSMGERPVIYDSTMASTSCRDLLAEVQNRGFLDAHVSVGTAVKGKKLRAVYLVRPGSPYYIRKVEREIGDSTIARLLSYDRGSLLHDGMQFNVNTLDQERKRITSLLLDQGYYRFHKEFIGYTADSVANSRDVDIRLQLMPFRSVADTTPRLHPVYRLRDVTFEQNADGNNRLRTQVMQDNCLLQPGQLYRQSDLQTTYNRFARLPAVRYTNIRFNEVPDSGLLDCRLQLSTNKRRTISFQPEGTNTAGNWGAAATLAYQNRNLFRGSELLSIQFRGAYEAITGLEGYANQDYQEFGLETKLTFPRFLLPFIKQGMRRRLNAATEFSLLYNTQNRPEFHRRALTGSWRYRWGFQGHRPQFTFDLIDLTYISMPWISDTFRKLYLDNVSTRNAILKYNYQDIFIAQSAFGYNYAVDNYAIRLQLATAGNLLQLFSKTIRADRNDDGQYKLFNVAFAQYVRFYFDFVKNVTIAEGHQLALHADFGLAAPYGNSNMLPFDKRFFSGGANSVRGWNVRGLGPGAYRRQNGAIDIINQTGDVKLDLNVEYRAKLFWKFSSALFIDAGNIWTLRAYDDQPDGQFRFNSFLQQLAASYGAGLRLNFGYFILRFDAAMKAVNPVYDNSREHFPIIHPRLSRDFTFHFAVGLPF